MQVTSGRVAKPGGRLAISEVTTACWSFKQDVRGYSGAGYSGVGVWLKKLESTPFRHDKLPGEIVPLGVLTRARRTLDDAGLQASSLLAVGDFTYRSARLRRARLTHALFAIEAARTLGADCLIVVPGPLRGLPYAVAQEVVTDALREMLPVAGDCGVRLAVEPVAPPFSTFINTLDEALAIVEAVGSPSCGVFFDAYQLWQTPDLAHQIRRAAPHIMGVHLADTSQTRPYGDRLALGDGVVPLLDIVRALVAAGYDGWFEVELISPKRRQDTYPELLRRLHCVLAALVSEAGTPERPPHSAARQGGKSA